MMDAFNDTAASLVPLLPWLNLAKVTVLLLGFFGLSFALRHRAPGVRHVLWTTGLAAIVVMPLLSLQTPWHADVVPTFLPSAPVALEPVQSSVSATPARTPSVASQTTAKEPATTRTEQPLEQDGETTWVTAGRIAERDASAGTPPLGSVILGVWLTGVLFVLLRFSIGVATLSWFAHRAQPARIREQVVSACERLGIKRRVRVLVSPVLGMPITWGVMRPTILLPAESADWGAERMWSVLLHELSHVRRRDALWHTLTRIACAVYWFHPLVWMAARQHELESERACDAAVTVAGISRKRYATHLIDFARRRDFHTAPAALIPMARRSQLRRRLETLLGARPVTTASPLTAVAVALAVMVTTSAVAALRTSPVKWGERKWGGSDPERRSYADNMFNRSVGTFVLTDDGYTMAKWGADGSTYSVEFAGTIHISDDDKRVTSVSSDGFFVVQEVRSKDKRRYEAYPDGRGGIEEQLYESDHASRLGEADGWIASMITRLVRQTGLDAERRVERILEEEGPQGVLDEIDHLTSDNARRLYFRYLFASGKLDKDQTRVAVRTIGNSIESDGDKATLLIDIAGDFVEDPELTRQFFETSETISSDGDRHRVIMAILERNPLPASTVPIALRSIGGISSDGDQSDLLVRAAELFEIEGDVARAFFEALESVSSDGDHARVLVRVIEQQDPSEETQRLLLQSATRISSDGDQARVLMRFAQKHGITESISGDFFRAVDTISSDGDHGRVLIEVCRQPHLPTGVRVALLWSASHISSDGDKAEVLAEAAQLCRDDDDLRQTFIDVAESISSDSDYRRVMRLFSGSEAVR